MTVQEFLQRNPDSTLNLMTPSGYITLTPEMSKSLQLGKPVLGHAGTDEVRQPIPAEHLLHQELVQIHPHKTIPHYFGAITDDKAPVQELKRLETMDLSYCTLLGKDFSGVCFDGADFQYSTLHNTNFQNTVFLNCDLSKAKLTDCNLDGAVMVNCHCFDASLENCSTNGMRMKGCKIEALEVFGSELSDIQMDDMTRKSIPAPMDLEKATVRELLQRCISQTDLEIMCAQHVLWLNSMGGKQADFSNSRLTKLDMRHMNFNGAILERAMFEDVDLSGANLSHAMLGEAKFTDCFLYGICAEESDMCFASFQGCDIRHGKFTGSNLLGVEMTNSKLLGMDVQNCCLDNSDIHNHTNVLRNYDSAFLSEGDWIQNQQDGMPGMGGLQ